MRARTLLFLLAAVVVAGLLVLLSANGSRTGQPAGSSPAPSGGRGRLFDHAPLDVSRIGIDAGDVHAELRREQTGWMMAKPLKVPANSALMARWVSLVEDLRRNDVITAGQRKERKLELADYGLAEPRARLTLGGVDLSVQIMIGDEAPLGGNVYVRFADSDDVVATDGVLTNVIPPSLESLRDRTLLRGEAESVARIELHRKGAAFVQLARHDGKWRLQQPLAAPADTTQVNGLIKAVLSIRAMSFVADNGDGAAGMQNDEVGPEAWVEPYGLAEDEAVARVTVWNEGSEAGREILFGKDAPEKTVYARNRDMESVVTVSTNALRRLLVSADSLRERHLLVAPAADVVRINIQRDGSRLGLERLPSLAWRITAPVQWDADPASVKGMLDQLALWKAVEFHDGVQTNMAAFGLDKPVYTVEIWTGTPAAGAAAAPETKPVVLEVGGVCSTSAAVYVRADGGNSVMEVPLRSISALGENPADPLLYRCRTLLALAPDHILGISIQKPGGKQSIVRQADGSWRASQPPGGVPSASAVGDVLFLASNLRAIRMHSRSMEKLASSGLDKPSVSLTFALDGEGGIQKTLVLGAPSRGDGVFAMVQGMDVVFVLANSEAGRLARNLVDTPIPGAVP